MVDKTSTRRAPWHVIPANNKPFGRLAAFRIIVDRLSKGVTLEPRPLDPAVADAADELLGVRPATRARLSHQRERYQSNSTPRRELTGGNWGFYVATCHGP